MVILVEKPSCSMFNTPSQGSHLFTVTGCRCSQSGGAFAFRQMEWLSTGQGVRNIWVTSCEWKISKRICLRDSTKVQLGERSNSRSSWEAQRANTSPSPPPIRLERLRWTKKRRQFSIKTGEKGTVKELLLVDLPLKRVRREHEELSRAHVLNFSSTTASRAHVRAWVSWP